jgi:hypothetical protein
VLPVGLVKRVDLVLPKGTLRFYRRSTCGESSEEGAERLGEPLFRLVRNQRKCCMQHALDTRKDRVAPTERARKHPRPEG